MSTMSQKLSRFVSLLTGLGVQRQKSTKKDLHRGDVIAFDNGHWQSFAVYEGQNMVIMYGKDVHGNKSVHERLLLDFAKDGGELWVCDFPKYYGRPAEYGVNMQQSSVVPRVRNYTDEIMEYERNRKAYHLYTPEETVMRARSRLGEQNIEGGTSEHFALWCKTGIAESHQQRDIKCILDDMKVYYES